MASKIIVGNISLDTTEDVIRELFKEKVGSVLAITLPQDIKTKQNRGYAIVEMKSDEQANEAVTGLNGVSLLGRALAITVSEKAPATRKWYQLGAKEKKA